MSNQSGHLHLTILIIGLFVAAVATAYYLGTLKGSFLPLTFSDKQESSSSAEQPTPSPSATPQPTIAPTNTPSATQVPATEKPKQSNNTADSSSPTYIKVTSPNGGETFKVGDTIHISWDSNNLNKSGSCVVKLVFEDGGTSVGWAPVNTPNGSSDWKIAADSGAKKAKVDMQCYDTNSNGYTDQSDNFFTINN